MNFQSHTIPSEPPAPAAGPAPANGLVALGVSLLPVPVPAVRVLGLAAIISGLGFQFYDEFEARRQKPDPQREG